MERAVQHPMMPQWHHNRLMTGCCNKNILKRNFSIALTLWGELCSCLACNWCKRHKNLKHIVLPHGYCGHNHYEVLGEGEQRKRVACEYVCVAKASWLHSLFIIWTHELSCFLGVGGAYSLSCSLPSSICSGFISLAAGLAVLVA